VLVFQRGNLFSAVGDEAQAVDYIVDHLHLPKCRACGLVKQAHSTRYYRSVKDPQTALRARMRELRIPGFATAIGACMCCSSAKTGV